MRAIVDSIRDQRRKVVMRTRERKTVSGIQRQDGCSGLALDRGRGVRSWSMSSCQSTLLAW